MGNGRRGWILKWLSATCATLFIGGGNVLGTVVARWIAEAGLNLDWTAVHWTITLAVWITGGMISALIYGLGSAFSRIDVLETWLYSLDQAARNREA